MNEVSEPNVPIAPGVASVVGDLLGLLDGAANVGVDGFYLVGSIALDDYHSGRSDIDFLAILAPDADVRALAAIHATLAERHRNVHCDGVYLEPGELSRPPAIAGPVARNGTITLESLEERQPVTWLTLLRHGRAVRGPEPDAGWIAADVDAAIAYSRDNVRSYWRPWLESRRHAGDRPLLNDWAVEWGALGVVRLHGLITTGEILSKTGAGRYALAAFPEHGPLLHEALRLREGLGSAYMQERSRSQDLVRFMDAVMHEL